MSESSGREPRDEAKAIEAARDAFWKLGVNDVGNDGDLWEERITAACRAYAEALGPSPRSPTGEAEAPLPPAHLSAWERIAWVQGWNASCREHAHPAAPTTPPPEWGTAHREPNRVGWAVVAKCHCSIRHTSPALRVVGRHCESHTFADLVSGEARLRAAQQQEDGK